jgi:hypothetical protein
VTQTARRTSAARLALLVVAVTSCSAEPEPDVASAGGSKAAGSGGASAGGGGTMNGRGGTAGAGAAGSAGSMARAGSSAGGASGGMAGGAAGASPAGSGGTAAVGGGGTSGGTAGSSGAMSSGGAGTGSGGNGAGTAGASAGAAGATAGASGSAGAPAGCDGSFAICEDFETTAVGAVPMGWTKVGDAGTSNTDAHRGAQSLEIGAAASGARRMRLTGERVTALGGTHWGRVFYKVKTPAPEPSSGVIHSTIVAWDATSPISGTNEVRVVDTVEDAEGRHQYLYNVQTSNRGEFGKGSTYDYTYDGAWYCTEWFVDYATQTYRFFLDGEELESIKVMNGAGVFENSELPSEFTALSVGWNNYQQASPGFVAWIDDLAIGDVRIGCN